MYRKTILTFVAILTIFTLVSACTGGQVKVVRTISGMDNVNPVQTTIEKTKEQDQAGTTEDEALIKAADLLNRMTLDEKIGQMTQVEKDSIIPAEITKFFIGSVCSGGGGSPENNSPAGWAEMTDGFQKAALQTRLAIPLIYGADAIHGHGNLYGATIFPQPVGLGATRDAGLVHEIGIATAKEMAATGVRWNFAPIVAVPQDIRWGRTYESYSEDTDLVTELTNAYLEGLQSPLDTGDGTPIHILATPKHYLGDGGTTFGTSTQNIIQSYLIDQGDMRYSETDIRQMFLPPYESAVLNGARSVMVSFSSWNGVKMHAQKYWITDVLKGELGFTGFVVSDWAGIDQIDTNYYKAVVTAINAGIDMNMVPYNFERFINVIKQAVMKGDISLERIDDAVLRILRVKFEVGLFDSPFADPVSLPTVGSAEHRELARKAVRESLVLLKNDNKTLPITSKDQLIFVGGVGADDMGMQCGGWTMRWQGLMGDILPGTTILDGLREAAHAGTEVIYEPNAEFVGMADLGIAVVGEIPYAEGVGDRDTLKLYNTDVMLINKMREHSKKLVVILLSGRPMVITPQYQVADAWVAAWLPGSEGAGVADVLFGKYPFTGKSPYTWPRSNAQLPINIHNPGGTGCDAPLFPFGYGLGNAGSKPIIWMECNE